MYGTIARMQAKPGHEEQLAAVTKEWEQERKAQAQGFVAGYRLKPEASSNEQFLVAVFEDRETYRRNAEDPEQDRWYHRLREHLTGDPAWTDGEVERVG